MRNYFEDMPALFRLHTISFFAVEHAEVRLASGLVDQQKIFRKIYETEKRDQSG